MFAAPGRWAPSRDQTQPLVAAVNTFLPEAGICAAAIHRGWVAMIEHQDSESVLTSLRVCDVVRGTAEALVRELQSVDRRARRESRTLATEQEAATVRTMFWGGLVDGIADAERALAPDAQSQLAVEVRSTLVPWLLRNTYWNRSLVKPHGVQLCDVSRRRTLPPRPLRELARGRKFDRVMRDITDKPRLVGVVFEHRVPKLLRTSACTTRSRISKPREPGRWIACY
jgi:hypothetical protein